MLIVLMIALFSGSPAWGAVPQVGSMDVETAFKHGCEFYESGDFSQAIGVFESLVERNVKNSRVYFNLANSYYKSGQLGKAVVDYRRALMLAPRDEDIKANLTLARSAVGVGDTLTSFDLRMLARLPVDLFSPREIELLFYGLSYLAAGVVVALTLAPSRMRRPLRYCFIIASTLVVALFVLKLGKRSQLANSREAVVISTTDLMSGPGAAFEQLGVLREGTEVRLRSHSGLWIEIELPAGEVGWVKAQSLELL